MFYKRLNSTPKKASTVASYEKDSSLKPAQKRHLRVKGWTKNVNLFEKNMVIIPICEHSHWYLVIAIRPGLITVSSVNYLKSFLVTISSDPRRLRGQGQEGRTLHDSAGQHGGQQDRRCEQYQTLLSCRVESQDVR